VALEKGGLLESLAGGGYRLGPTLVELGGQVISRTGFVAAAEGVIEHLPQRDGTEVHLGQLVDGWIVYLGRVSGEIRLPMRNRVGLSLPAVETGCGKAALSLINPDEARDRIQRVARQQNREVSAKTLNRADSELRNIRRRGWVICDRVQPGRLSVAAGIQHTNGTTVGGLSVAGPKQIFTKQFLRRITADVLSAAHKISRNITDTTT
jgi:IclR family acetate operon transcriptional repressor